MEKNQESSSKKIVISVLGTVIAGVIITLFHYYSGIKPDGSSNKPLLSEQDRNTTITETVNQRNIYVEGDYVENDYKSSDISIISSKGNETTTLNQIEEIHSITPSDDNHSILNDDVTKNKESNRYPFQFKGMLDLGEFDREDIAIECSNCQSYEVTKIDAYGNFTIDYNLNNISSISQLVVNFYFRQRLLHRESIPYTQTEKTISLD